MNNKELKLELLVPDSLINFSEEELGLVYKTPRGLNKWECKFEIKRDDKKVIVLVSDKEGEVINRREAFRVNCNQDISYITELGEFSGKLLDISILGMQLLTEEVHEIGDVLLIKHLASNHAIISNAKVVRTGEKTDSGLTYGLRFLEEAPAELAREVNDLQLIEVRKRRQKSLGY